MSHVSHATTLYACADCRNVFAGIHDQEPGTDGEVPPDVCAVYGSDMLVELSKLEAA